MSTQELRRRQADVNEHSQTPVYPVGSGKANVALISCLAGNPEPRLTRRHCCTSQLRKARFVDSATRVRNLSQHKTPTACFPETVRA